MTSKPIKPISTKGSNPTTNASESSKASSPRLDKLEELLDEDGWDEDSRISIDQLTIHHGPAHDPPSKPSLNPKSWSKTGQRTGLVTTIVLGIIAALKTAYELGWLNWIGG